MIIDAPGPRTLAVIRRQFLSFASVGIFGFIVDTTMLYMAMIFLGAGLYWGRVISYLAAATSTWALNRRYTFKNRRSANLFGEWGRFLAVNVLGGVVNYFTYAWLVTGYSFVADFPVLGVAAGSLAGLVVNFVSSRSLVFTGRGVDH